MKRRNVIFNGVVALTALSVVPTAMAQSLQAVLTTPPPLICAHRGWTDPSETENSLSQMRRTHQVGPFMMEIDLAKDASGRIVLLHDQNVDRTTTGHGPLAELSPADIHKLALKNEFGPTHEHIPAYDAVLDWAARTPDVLLMLDIKDVPPADALKAVRRQHLSDRVVVLTFQEKQAREAFKADPDALISVLITTPDDLAAYRQIAGHRRFAAYIPKTSKLSLFRKAHQAGAIVITDLLGPTAVTDIMSPEEGAHHARSLPIDILVTNTPLQLQAALRKHP
ncbi:glycerophosphodiester phosphodiesterase family protein [Gluconobacter japonicus]|uniref:glycerophosphodiester phosphodiesterase family protein n=1 Tax=Gluconobacter japonicus TaxID=376620 RepID=UPI0024ACFFF2|nr:glycerophosphodiester phosphodiesterase family protein [Gluconobacter japonicus]MDI6653296.1 glycerophosphodiester phosphodiesterase family protein [Gluconobacter japonicus]